MLAQRPTLRSIVGHAAQEVVSTGPKKVGESAPEFELSDLEGQSVSLQDFKGEHTLLLFWSPDCGFCQQLLPDLKQWEANRPKGAPRLLAVLVKGVAYLCAGRYDEDGPAASEG
jgi:thiol-disulfide isomerase/thioredoxin